MRYRRTQTPGGTYFFTVVTHERRPILCEPENVPLLRQAFRRVMRNHPYRIDAFVLLPDHLHCIWTLPENDRNFSVRWRLIKSYFSRACDDKYSGSVTASRIRKQERGFWQHK